MARPINRTSIIADSVGPRTRGLMGFATKSAFKTRSLLLYPSYAVPRRRVDGVSLPGASFPEMPQIRRRLVLAGGHQPVVGAEIIKLIADADIGRAPVTILLG